jgi:poly-gamma-glutamate capsule biosynthesis protein CapA/YwtB (metallophosphatase superfamily)
MLLFFQYLLILLITTISFSCNDKENSKQSLNVVMDKKVNLKSNSITTKDQVPRHISSSRLSKKSSIPALTSKNPIAPLVAPVKPSNSSIGSPISTGDSRPSIHEKSNKIKKIRTLTIAAVGDLMAQKELKEFADSQPNGWKNLFSEVQPHLQNADIAFGNLETPITNISWDEKREKIYGTAPSPIFRSSSKMIKGLKGAGFDILSIANNHIFDQGPAGMKSTYKTLKKHGIIIVGAEKDGDPQLKIIKKNGISIGFAAFTTFINIRPKSWRLKGYRISRIGIKSNHGIRKTTNLINKWKNSVDFLVLSIHWGVEFRTYSKKWQRIATNRYIRNGADIILGHHPHVLQPGYLFKSNGNKTGFVQYSMGNAISAMGIKNINRFSSSLAQQNDSMVLLLKLSLSHDGKKIIIPSYIPTFMHISKTEGGYSFQLKNLLTQIETLKKQEDCNNRKTLCYIYKYRLKSIKRILTRIDTVSPTY